MTTNKNLPDLRDLDDAALATVVKDLGQPSFRAKQISQWVWNQHAQSMDEMLNLPKPFRTALQEQFQLHPLNLVQQQKSSDGTIKMRFQLWDGDSIEAVLIPLVKYKRVTLCVSSQSGCSLSCKFCATGKMGLRRNLMAWEIVEQYQQANKISQKTYGMPITNIVYMGMGEPLLNYAQVLRSLQILTSDDKLNIAAHRITISTAGIAKMMKRLADDFPRVNLALSLHAAQDDKRSTMMAINDSNNLAVLKEALLYFQQNAKGKLSFEYIALQGINLDQEDIHALIQLSKGLDVKVNVIEYNSIGDEQYRRAKEEEVNAFVAQMLKARVRTTIRRSRGQDIDAACGQLANKQDA